MPGGFPVDFDLGDVNADGFTDVVVANGAEPSTVEVLIGQTGGSFVRSGAISIGTKAIRLTLATLDAGSTLDLAVVTEPAGSSNQLQILFGDASGGFLAQTPIPLPDRPSDVLAGDLNGDGQNDLVVMLFFTNRATPFINQGNGSFAAAPPLDFGGRPGHYELRDLNADGRADLVATVFIGSANLLRVYLAGTDGVLHQVQEIIPPDSASVGPISFHDFSGDGRSDLVATMLGRRLVYYAGNADGKFGSEQTLLEDLQGYNRCLKWPTSTPMAVSTCLA